MRGDILLQGMEVLEVLLDGRSHPLEAFAGFGLSEKTLYRILDTLSLVHKFRVYTIKYEGKTYWRSDYIPRGSGPRYEVIKCYGCQTPKPVTEFHKSRNSPTGYKGYCKLCAKDYEKHWRETNGERKNKKIRDRYRNDSEFRSRRIQIACRYAKRKRLRKKLQAQDEKS